MIREAVHGILLMVLAVLFSVYQAIGLVNSIKEDRKQFTNEKNKAIPSGHDLDECGQEDDASSDFSPEFFRQRLQRLYEVMCLIGDIVLLIGFAVVYR